MKYGIQRTNKRGIALNCGRLRNLFLSLIVFTLALSMCALCSAYADNKVIAALNHNEAEISANTATTETDVVEAAANGYAVTVTSEQELRDALNNEENACVKIPESYQYYSDNVGLVQLATPTDLQWGTEMPGDISWSCGEPTQQYFKLKIYKQGETEPFVSPTWSFSGSSMHVYSVPTFCTSDAGTGDYYFTVTSISSEDGYRDSATATSPVWHYERPDAALGACSNIQVSNNGWTFRMPSDPAYVGGYQTIMYYAASENDTPREIGSNTYLSESSNYSALQSVNVSVPEYWVQRNGAGYYSFKVQALSKNLTVAANSQWSDVGPAVYIGEDCYTLSFSGGIAEYTAGTSDNWLGVTVGGLNPQAYYEKYSSLAWESKNTGVLSFTEEYGWSGTTSTVKVNLNSVGTAYVTATTRDGNAATAGNLVVVHSASPATTPENLKTIEAEAFRNTDFEEIVLRSGVVSIGSGAFKDCENLKLITIPNSVTSIADDAFSGCTNVTILCSYSSAAAAFAQTNCIPCVMAN